MADITGVPERLEAVKLALPALEDMALRVASRDEIMEILGRRFAVFPQPERTDGEWAAWWADYLETLKDCPAVALEAAIAAYVALPDSEFFPKPGKLWAMAKCVQTDEARALSNARYVVRHVEGRPLPPPAEPELTPDEIAALEARKAEDRAKVREMAAQVAGALKTPEPKTRPMRPNHGPTDETGLTASMRSLIERRASA